MNGPLPLAGVGVLALEQAVAAPLCTRHLADLGADVIKVERPGEGDFARAYDSTAAGLSSWFVWLNRGKRSITLDLKHAQGQEIARRLAARSDVVVQNFAPGALDRLGLGVAQLHEQHPALIACSVTGYGEDGPYRDRKAYDLLIQGEAGVLSVTGTPEQPAKAGISIVDIAAGMYALSSVLAALLRRRETGEGAAIRISLFDSIMEWMLPLAVQARGGRPPPRAADRHATIVPYGPYHVAGGRRVMLAVQNEREWKRLCEDVLGHPEWVTDPRFARNEGRLANRALLEPLIEEALSQLSVEEAEERLDAAAIAFGRGNDVTEVFDHPQVAARGRLLPTDTVNGPVNLLRPPFNIEGTDAPTGAVPGLGEHTDAVLRELGYTPGEIAALHGDGAV
jgi:crotonobetainyl-CoA:carnitine CoA-transferase CaiB-like acyl-CoA transferase